MIAERNAYQAASSEDDEADDWHDAGIPFKYYEYCHRHEGLTIAQYKELHDAGLRDLEDYRTVLSIYDEDIAKHFNELMPFVRGIVAGQFTSADLNALITASKNQSQPTWVNGDTDHVLYHGDDIIAAATAIHNGANPADQVQILINKKSEFDAKIRAQEAATQKSLNERRLHAFGADIMAICHGQIRDFSFLASRSDPYAYNGQCVYDTIPAVEMAPNEFRQWWGTNAYLRVLPQYPFGAQPPILYRGDEHIRIGERFVAIGEAPTTYVTTLDAQQTATTFRILRYYSGDMFQYLSR